ncbi:hypothetical protein AFL01nite_04770 [Aeromicrobium flavum]|uniref:NAD glycohydrolase translocation F5/8 type C domain-containing protein n=1 Tax=Aeromicrobium flavum TaxID=416568 RepID=A0A512HRZ7_9ACTN|nr:hypothetical protein [Aeromicrobium flavum]GEO88150.1 hypothetical protein AFL01nite_04770 [Aeromicrobium flavum]
MTTDPGQGDPGPRPTLYSPDWFVDKLITPVVTGIVLTVFGFLAPGWLESRLRAPTCDDPRGLVQVDPKGAEGRALPGETFPIRGKVTYEPENLIDGNTSTAWAENEDDLGDGASVSLSFAKPEDLQLVCVVSGYAESWALYKRNSRPRLLEVTTEQGRRVAMLADAGSPDRPAVYQEVAAPDGRTSKITLTIRSAYAAQKDDSRTRAYLDTSISEVETWVDP